MISKLLRTNVLAIRCVDDLVLTGMGSTLYVYDKNSYQLRSKLNCLYPSNIHGIVVGPNNILAVFGAKSIFICDIIKQKEAVTFKKLNNNEFNDWIIALQWISVKKQLQLAILFAHNYISLYDISGNSCQIIYCKENCILYGGSISGTLKENLVIFSGTVFQEILIWKVDNNLDNNKSVPVLHRLKGHKGVIFSVVFDPYSHFVCSTSDDRTVRLWKVIGNKSSENGNINWQAATVVLVKTMYGHTARVWRATVRNDIVITIGEDSLICTWSLSGNLLNKVYAHHGAPIWSIDTSEDDKNIFTGGADGAVCVWPTACYNSPKIISLASDNTHDIPKYISYLNSGTILIFNEKGTLFCYNKDETTPKDSLYLEKYCNYCIMKVSSCRSFVAFASRDGYVTLYKEIIDTNTNTRHLHQVLEERIMESQIFSLQWLRDDTLIACGANGLLRIFNFTINGTTNVEAECMLPPSRERWLTAATIYEDLLVCGDRTGNVYIFELKNESGNIKKSSQTLIKVHGKIGVQSFDMLEGKLMTTGRDGMLRFYELNKENRNSLMTLYRKKMPMDWISGTLKMDGILLVLGFKEVEFIIYNLPQERLLVRIPCGGGHRSWDCTILNNMASFAYIRNKQVYVFDYPLRSLKLPLLQNGFHVKEIYCLQRIASLGAQDIFVSGGEDCTLRVSCISQVSRSDSGVFHNLGVYDGHLSGIRCISTVKLSDESSSRHLVFSGGGRAQLKIWQMNFKRNGKSSPNVDLSCFDIKSHMLYGQDQYRKKLWQETEHSYVVEPETRYMDIYAYYPSESLNHVLIFVACAGGYLRIFIYDIKTSNTYLKVSTKYIDRCILKMHVLSHERKMIVLTMTTDGMLHFFDLTDVVSTIYEDADLENQNIKSTRYCRL
ncbi:PREDICTED: WD repeat-containing protein 6 isoform X2 [Dinoponera quadriceps]|uniref:tRNA (34-2'-O)-methyltransferase regulator WDR6 n=1 Tax=Dinoponera quadriceps TaxID=609295 RepID=A0A6P3WQC8_DINQU|nr:PREDICTED: WD repeat-containing protein 6 isoform X2 [Dinoponera quadriceps]